MEMSLFVSQICLCLVVKGVVEVVVAVVATVTKGFIFFVVANKWKKPPDDIFKMLMTKLDTKNY